MRARTAAWLGLLCLVACDGQVGGQSGTEGHPTDQPAGPDCACDPMAAGCETVRTSVVATDDDAGFDAEDDAGVYATDAQGERGDLVTGAGAANPTGACTSDAPTD